MHKKALTVAIAGALAAPMAAQAVDFTISGHVNRALFLTDEDGGSKTARVQDNGGSGTRIRANGSTEMEDGNKVGIQFEYGAGSSFSLRHANVQYSGGFGKMTIGQGSEAGDGSAYSDTTGVFGIGHGAGTPSDFTLGSYFGSLDAGSRVEMIRYDTPSLGPASVAVSLANGDRVSGRFKLSSDFGGTSVGAQLATLQQPGDTSTIGASIGATMASGLTLSGAWAKGKEMGAKPAVPMKREVKAGMDCATGDSGCIPIDGAGLRVVTTPGTPAVPATDPSYFQAEIGYKFGNSGVAVSWYKSDDFVREGSKGTALGIGAVHKLPKANAELYIAMQNYDVTDGAAGDQEETVYVVGSRVKF